MWKIILKIVQKEVGLELETRGIELVYANYVEKDVMVIADGGADPPCYP